jgi:phosphoribosylaminoimidazolecarboxamide formyltransferase / IMP cyclohydrolase
VRALLSVSDKRGVVEFARDLAALGWELVSTGGTAETLRQAGLAVIPIERVTGFPEMMDGRVKTLHPKVHGGLLARRAHPGDRAALAEHGITPIDLVAVNLYPFRETVAKPGVTFEQAIEQIDIGGPSMLRSAAKNHQDVIVIVDPDDYPVVTAALKSGELTPGASPGNTEGRSTAVSPLPGTPGSPLPGTPGLRPGSVNTDLRKQLAAKVFAHTAAYDAAIHTYLTKDAPGWPERITLALDRLQELRYGENPHQAAALYATSEPGIRDLQQLHGKELSFNNLLDLEAAVAAVAPWAGSDAVACAIIKHTTPCGIALGRAPRDAYERALATDRTSAFGSVIAFNGAVDRGAAEAMRDLFVEVVVAPAFADDALSVLREKKNLRVVRLPGGDAGGGWGWDYKRVRGGFLVQQRSRPAQATDETGWKVVTRRAPTDAEWRDLRFAWAAVGVVKSNAILLARDQAAVGIGAGQMSRVDASFLAIHKARQQGHDPAGAVLASDAFFPFPDGVEEAARAGVAAIIQPGGSVKDADVVAAADQAGVAMVFTGIRQFRH